MTNCRTSTHARGANALAQDDTNEEKLSKTSRRNNKIFNDQLSSSPSKSIPQFSDRNRNFKVITDREKGASWDQICEKRQIGLFFYCNQFSFLIDIKKLLEIDEPFSRINCLLFRLFHAPQKFRFLPRIL